MLIAFTWSGCLEPRVSVPSATNDLVKFLDGHRPVRFDRFVPYMWDVIDNAYGFLEKAVKRCEISASRN